MLAEHEAGLRHLEKHWTRSAGPGMRWSGDAA